MTYTAKNAKQLRTEGGSLLTKLASELDLIDDEIGFMNTGSTVSTFSKGVAVTLPAAVTALNIDAGATDHTGATIITCDLDVNSADVKFVNADIDVGTALSSGEKVYGIYIDIDGLGGDHAASGMTAFYATSANNTGGVNKAIEIAGTWDIAVQVGTSAAKITLPAAASRAIDVNTTTSIASGVLASISLNQTVTGAGGASAETAQFALTSNITLGTFANALTARIDNQTAGAVTGLQGVICAELNMAGGAVAAGTYSLFEAEINCPTSYSGSVPIDVFYISAWGAQVAQFDTSGYLMEITGVTAGTNKFFRVAAPTTLAASLRCKVAGTTYYLPLYSAQA